MVTVTLGLERWGKRFQIWKVRSLKQINKWEEDRDKIKGKEIERQQSEGKRGRGGENEE